MPPRYSLISFYSISFKKLRRKEVFAQIKNNRVIVWNEKVKKRGRELQRDNGQERE